MQTQTSFDYDIKKPFKTPENPAKLTELYFLNSNNQCNDNASTRLVNQIGFVVSRLANFPLFRLPNQDSAMAK